MTVDWPNERESIDPSALPMWVQALVWAILFFVAATSACLFSALI